MISGSPKATFHYPRFTYGSVTVDLVEPAVAITPVTAGLRGQNLVASGKAEYLFGRLEEGVSLQLLCEPDQLQQLRWMLEDALAQGTQFKAWIDRFTGSCWMFEKNRKDQNGLAVTLNGGGAETYALGVQGSARYGGYGIVLSGSQYLSVALAQASAGTPTGFDDPLLKDEGVVHIDFKPTFASNDSALHTILNTSVGGGGANELRLYKSSVNQLLFRLADASSSAFREQYFDISEVPAWSANARVQLIASWLPTGLLELRCAVNGGAFATSGNTTFAGGGTGLLTALPTTLFLGSDNAGANRANGTYDTIAFFKKAFTKPHLTLSDFRPLSRNHFPYAEATAPVFQPTRLSPGRQIWQWPLSIRNGRP